MCAAENKEMVIHKLLSDSLCIHKESKNKVIFCRGEQIFKQGDFAPHVVWVVSGLVKVYLQTENERQVNICFAKTGDFLAISSAFGESIHTYSAQALKDSEICMIDKDHMKNALISNPGFAMYITGRNYRIEGILSGIIKKLSRKQMRGKLASSLLYISQKEFTEENIFEYITLRDVAGFSSVSVNGTLKFLKEFEKEGIVCLNGKEMKILDAGKLLQISNNG